MSRTKKRESAASKKRTIAIVAAACTAVVLVVAFAATAFTLLRGNDIYQGVHVGAVDVGGMSRREAEAAVEAQYGGSAARQDLGIKVGDKTFTLSADECPIRYDTQRAVTAAYSYGREGGLFRRLSEVLRARRGEGIVELPLVVDDVTLQKQMGAIAQTVKVDYRPSGYTYEEGVLTVDKGAAGYGIDAGKLTETVRAHLMAGKTELVEVALGVEQPKPLDWEALAVLVKSEIREPSLDLERDPSGNTILPGQPGRTLDVAAAKAAVEAVDGPVTVPISSTAPNMSDADFKALIFRDVLGSASSTFSTSNKNRTANVKLAAQFCNNVVLMPGDVFSYNTVVGPRTAERGFKEADVYVGNSVEKGLGGGICQVTSTIYVATLYADLEIVQRYNHSRDVSYVPDGIDATVVYGSKDYQFKNNSEYPIRVQTIVKGGKLTVNIYGTQTVEGKEIKMRVEELSRDPAVNKMILDTSLAPGTYKASSNVYDGFKTQSYRQVWINGVMVSETPEAYSSYKRYDYTTTIRYNPAVETPDPGTGETPGGETPGAGDVPVGGEVGAGGLTPDPA
jgi:vancomycin resistance protein YoaR